MKYSLLISLLLFVSCIVNQKKEDSTELTDSQPISSSSVALSLSSVQSIQQALFTVSLVNLQQKLQTLPIERGVLTVTWSDGTTEVQEVSSNEQLILGTLSFTVAPKNSARFTVNFVALVKGKVLGTATKSSVLPKGDTPIPLVLMIDNSGITLLTGEKVESPRGGQSNPITQSSNWWVNISSSTYQNESSDKSIGNPDESSDIEQSSQAYSLSSSLSSGAAISSYTATSSAEKLSSSPEWIDCAADEYGERSVVHDCSTLPTNYKTYTNIDGSFQPYPTTWFNANLPLLPVPSNQLPANLHNAFQIDIQYDDFRDMSLSFALSNTSSPDMSGYSSISFWAKFSELVTTPSFYMQHAPTEAALTYSEEWPQELSTWLFFFNGLNDNSWHYIELDLSNSWIMVDGSPCDNCDFENNNFGVVDNVFAIDFYMQFAGDATFAIGDMLFHQ